MCVVENIEHNIALNAIQGGGGGGGGEGGGGGDEEEMEHSMGLNRVTPWETQVAQGKAMGGPCDMVSLETLEPHGSSQIKSMCVASASSKVEAFGRRSSSWRVPRMHVSRLDISDCCSWPPRGSMDVVIASDIIYDKAQVPACVKAVTYILKEGKHQSPSPLNEEEEEEEERRRRGRLGPNELFLT